MNKKSQIPHFKTKCSLEKAANEALKTLGAEELERRLSGIENGKTARVYSVNNQTEYDGNTGQVTHNMRQYTTKFSTQPGYFKVYLKDAHRLTKLKKSQKDVLFSLAAIMNFKGEIILNKRLREEIAQKIGTSTDALSIRISELKKAGVILSICSNEYFIDPELISRGDWKVIATQRMYWRCVSKFDKEGNEFK